MPKTKEGKTVTEMEALRPVMEARDRAIDIPTLGPEKVAADNEWRAAWRKYWKLAVKNGWVNEPISSASVT